MKDKIKIFDRLLISDFIKFAILAVMCVVTIYLLIDLFEELDYFISRHTSVLVVFLYYLYSMPSAISLFLPVGVILSCFLNYGLMMRERSIYVCQSAGISIYRLFLPVIVIGVSLIVIQFLFYEFVTIPANRKLEELRRVKIEKRYGSIATKRYNLYLRGKEQRVYFIYEYESVNPTIGERTGVMRNFIIVELSNTGQLLKRIDGKEATFSNRHWLAKNVSVRYFKADTLESYQHFDTLTLAIKEKPGDFTDETRPIEQLFIWELNGYLKQLKFAGVNTAKAEVEFHYRIASLFISIILILLSLPLAVRLRHGGGIMFGLGLGLLFSFIYWGLIQIAKAFGQVSLVAPFWSAWIPNIVFLIIGLYLFYSVKQ
ncbi:MAG: LptF/LptG family permease [candidate division WOR-3 bacterium]